MRSVQYHFRKCGDLLDHLVGAAEQREGKGQAERLGAFQIDHQLNLDGLLHRKFARVALFVAPLLNHR